MIKSRASPSEKRWNAPSSTACQAPPAAPSPRRWHNASPSSFIRSVVMAWPRDHATTLAMSRLLQSCRPGVFPGSRGPNLCIPPGDVSFPGSGRTQAHTCSPLPSPLCWSSRLRPPSSNCAGSWLRQYGRYILSSRGVCILVVSFLFFTWSLCTRPEWPSFSSPALPLFSPPPLSSYCWMRVMKYVGDCIKNME